MSSTFETLRLDTTRTERRFVLPAFAICASVNGHAQSVVITAPIVAAHPAPSR